LLKLPHKLPGIHTSAPGVVSISDADVGGYDFMVGGHGFRLATDQQFAYVRGSEPTTTHRFDSSLEPGEQSLSPLPWIKSQSSFHGGAGQLNLEQGLTAFQYQQEQVEHIRFDNCQGVDVWTPGQVTRLPDTRFFNFGFTSTCAVTATVGGIDYAIIGGAGGLYQAAWTSGPDADPVVTRISLVNSTYVNDANCNVTSLTTDGSSYYGIVQMTSVGYNPNILTYVFAGSVNSTTTPEAIYRVPNLLQGPAFHNLCTNPSFENNLTDWNLYYQTPTLNYNPVFSAGYGNFARSTTRQFVGAASCQYTAVGGKLAQASTGKYGEGILLQVPTVAGQVYTVSAYVYVEPGGTMQQVVNGGLTGFFGRGSTTSAFSTWQRVEATFTALSTTTIVGIGNAEGTTSVASSVIYVDAVKIENSSWSSIDYFDGSTAATSTYTYSWDGTAGNSTSTANPWSPSLRRPASSAGRRPDSSGCSAAACTS
jgi:hypothetical protein